MKKVVLVVGLKGVGKSSVLSKIEGWKIVNFGDIMVKKINEKVGRDELQWKLGAEEYIELQREAGKELIRIVKRSKKDTFIDSHAIIETIFGILPGFPQEILEKLPLNAIVMIWARPEEIYSRILRDYYEKSRERTIVSVDKINFLQRMEEYISLVYSSIKGVPFIKIENPEGRIDYAVENLKEYLSRL